MIDHYTYKFKCAFEFICLFMYSFLTSLLFFTGKSKNMLKEMYNMYFFLGMHAQLQMCFFKVADEIIQKCINIYNMSMDDEEYKNFLFYIFNMVNIFIVFIH